MAKGSPGESGRSLIATNRKARQNYQVLERLEAGIALLGTEVKAMRNHDVDLSAAFARLENNQVILYDLHVKPYIFGHQFNHEPRRPRRLLLHRREIDKLVGKLSATGRTLVPLSLYFNRRGLVKVELALCQGRQQGDKREALRRKEADRETRQAIARHTGRR